MGRARDISKVFSTGTALATDTEVSTTYQTKATAGLTFITPISIANTGGTSSIGASGTVSFTSASAISLNDVFSSTYNNYLILIKAACSSATQLSLKMRVSNADLTSSSYMYGGAYGQFNGSATIAGENANGTPSAATVNGFNILDVDGNPSYARVQMFDPFATEQTGLIYDQVFNSGGSRNTGYWESFSGLTTVTTSYTGFTLLPATGTITGTVSVYGYNK